MDGAHRTVRREKMFLGPFHDAIGAGEFDEVGVRSSGSMSYSSVVERWWNQPA